MTKKEKTEKHRFKELISSTKKEMKEFRNNPVSSIKRAVGSSKKYMKANIFFVSFVLVNVTNGLLLRYLTMKTVDSFFAIQPLLADLAFITIIGAIGYLYKAKGRVIYWGIITLVCMLICVINSSYYTFYTSYASISLLSTSKFITEVGDAVVDSVIQIKDVAYFVLPISLIFSYRRLKKRGHFKKAETLDKSVDKAFYTALFGLIIALIFSASLTPTDWGRFAKQWNREYVVDKFGIYVYHINDLVKSIEPKISSLFGYDEAFKKFEEHYAKAEKPEKNKYTDIYKGKSIITIHAESIQSFVIGLKINGIEVTPNLNKLVAGGLYFDNFYTQVSVGTSSDTEFTLNTSLMPASTGTAFVSYFDRTYISIPSLLKKEGYYSMAFHGNSADYWNRRTMHKTLSYDKFYAKDSFQIDEKIGLGLSDASFFKQSVPYLKTEMEKNEKIYATMIMLTNHTPFYNVSQYAPFDVSLKEQVFENGEQVEKIYPYMTDTKLGRYLQSVHYADQEIGNFIDALEAEGLMKNTVIVVYGDHDARLPRKDYERFYNYDKINDDTLDNEDPNYQTFDKYQYELNRKVPLIIYAKNAKHKGTINYAMGMIDVMPTLGNMFGFYNKYALGKDIFDIKDDNTVYFPNGSWLTSNMYYNVQKEEQYIIREAVIDDNYIKVRTQESEELLAVSNSILIYDLLANKNLKKSKIDEVKIIEGASNE